MKIDLFNKYKEKLNLFVKIIKSTVLEKIKKKF